MEKTTDATNESWAKSRVSTDSAIQTGSIKEYNPRGGCGAKHPRERCLGCAHPFTEKEQVKQPITLSIHFEDSEVAELTVDIIGEILAELKRAEAKHSWENNNIERNALILSEEAGEVSRAVLRHVEEGKPISEVREELIQTGAMVLRFLKNLPK